MCCVDGLKRLCGRDVRDPYTADLKSYFDIAMTILIMKLSFLTIQKDDQVHFSACFLICTTMFVLNHGAEASGLTNVALHKPTAQGPETWSETDYQSIPSSFQSLKAVDGVDDTLGAKCAHTVGEGPKWWLVDLLGEYKIYTVAVLNRDTFSYRLQNFTVEIGNQDPRNMPGFPETVGQICFHHRSVVGGAEWAELDCASGFLTGQFVRVVKWGYEHLTLCEVRHGKRGRERERERERGGGGGKGDRGGVKGL